MPLDVGRVRVFVEVARCGSIAAAARRVSFTPSAVSQQVAKLEAELGCRLLDRGPGGIRLTDAGRLLVEHGERVLGELREAEAAVSVALAAGPSRLALGTFATAGTVLVPAALAELRRDHPRLHLSLLDLEPPDGYGLVASGDLDLLITHRYPGMPSTPLRGLIRRNLLLDPLRLVLPAPGPDEPGEVPLDSLAGRTWVSGGAGMPNRVCLEQLARRAGIEPQISYETTDYALTLALVGVGLGVALVPASVLSAARPSGVVVRDLAGPRPIREVCAVHRRRPSAVVVRLLGLIADAAARLSRA